VTLTLVCPTVIVEGRQACQGHSLFAADGAEFGHADDERQRGALADAGDAPAEIVMIAQLPGDAGEFGGAPCLHAGEVSHHHPPQPRRDDMFQSGFDARDVLLDLLDEGQLIRQLDQPCIWRALFC
jgi:hypothetical protein